MIYIKDIWQPIADDYKKFHLGLIDDYIKYLSSNPIDVCDRKILSFLLINKYKLVSDNIFDFRDSIVSYELIFDSLDAREMISRRVNRRIGYEILDRVMRNKRSLAYILAECFSVQEYKWCPFCQMNHVAVMITKEKKFRPAFDHYFCKSKYPFLALSLYNLIPICDRCNSIPFKGSKNFYWQEHLHPLFDNDEIDFNFRFSFKFIELIDGAEVKVDDFDISIRRKNNKTINNCNTFNLEYLYKKLSKERCVELIEDYVFYKKTSEVRLDGFNLRIDKFKPGINLNSYKKIHKGKMLLDLKSYLIN